MPETKVTFHDPENPNSGYTIENPYETKVRFSTPNLNKEGFIDIPKITVIGLINFLYVKAKYLLDFNFNYSSLIN